MSQHSRAQHGHAPIRTATTTAASLGIALASLVTTSGADPARAASRPAVAHTSASATRPADTNRVAYSYFVAKGLRPQQAAAIVGNLMQESGSPINPRARQRGGPGMGIAQWSRGQRWNALVRYAHATHRSEYALAVQLDYLWVELNGSERRAMGRLRATRTTPAATLAFSRWFERCAPRWCANGARTRNATRVLASYAR